MPASVYDLAIVGGGINGAGIARDAARPGPQGFSCRAGRSRGRNVVGKLEAHSRRIALPRAVALPARAGESLQEREVLLRIAPHIIHPLRFVLPYVPGMRSKGLIRLGLALLRPSIRAPSHSGLHAPSTSGVIRQAAH